MRSSSLKVYSPVEYTGYKEKRSGHPSEPGSRTGNRKTTRKPKPILYRLRRFCKRLNLKGIGGLAVTTVVIVFAVRGVVGMFSEHTQTKTAPITTSSPAAEESQPYVFYYGNNNYGKDSRESNYKAVPSYYESNKIARVATGTGPISWSHDKTMAGIWDLNGNVWEWQGGIRLVWGELQILANNDAADPDNPQNTTSTCWKAINAADGALVDPESKTTDSSAHVSGKTVKLDYVNNKWTYSTSITNTKDESRSCAFYQVAADSSIGDAAKVMLRALALLPDSDVTTDVYEGDYMWWNNGVAERCVFRGGCWSSGAYAGVFYLSGGNSRSYVYPDIGFRAAYIPEIR